MSQSPKKIEEAKLKLLDADYRAKLKLLDDDYDADKVKHD